MAGACPPAHFAFRASASCNIQMRVWGGGKAPTPLLHDLYRLCPLVVSQKDPALSGSPWIRAGAQIISGSDERGPWHGGGPEPCGHCGWPYACGSRAPWNAGASWADRYEAWGTPPHKISSRLSRPNNSPAWGCGLLFHAGDRPRSFGENGHKGPLSQSVIHYRRNRGRMSTTFFLSLPPFFPFFS